VILYATFIQGFSGLGLGKWRAPADAMGATLVRFGFPCPPTLFQTTNVLATGIQRSLEVAARNTGKRAGSDSDSRQETQKVKPKPVTSATKESGPEPPERINSVCEGGPVAALHTMTGPAPKGGFGFTGSGGDFGSRIFVVRQSGTTQQRYRRTG